MVGDPEVNGVNLVCRHYFRLARNTSVNSAGVTWQGFSSGIIVPNYVPRFRHKTRAV